MKSFCLVFAGLITTSFLSSPNPGNPGAQDAHTLLWKISGKNLKNPSYLFGTMHILCTDDAHLSDSLKGVIARCSEVYLEIDLSDMGGMMAAMKAMQMKDDKKLSDYLTQSQYARVKEYFEKHTSMLPFSMLERFKPLLISSVIEEQDLDCKTTDGMEMLILNQAKGKDKKIRGLETAAFQAGLFDSIPYERQAKELINFLDSMEQYKQQTQELIDTYRKQDLQKIDELTKSGDGNMEEYEDLLIYARNRKWVDSLKVLMPEKSLLIAVGAGHLPGDQGLISLLSRAGYSVSPVKN
jgi:uncharacterized protein YbaP (TraB family)